MPDEDAPRDTLEETVAVPEDVPVAVADPVAVGLAVLLAVGLPVPVTDGDAPRVKLDVAVPENVPDAVADPEDAPRDTLDVAVAVPLLDAVAVVVAVGLPVPEDVPVAVADPVAVGLAVPLVVELSSATASGVHTGDTAGRSHTGSTCSDDRSAWPHSLRPKHRRLPSRLTPHTVDAAGPEASAMRVLACGCRAKSSGKSRLKGHQPEHTALPLARRKHVWLTPGATDTTSRAATRVGTHAWPLALAPQHSGAPAVRTTHVWLAPAAMDTTPVSPAAGAAAPGGAPQHTTVPLERSAHVWAAPAVTDTTVASPTAGASNEGGTLR